MSIGLAVEALVVDDSPVDRSLAKGLLEKHTYLTVGVAGDGAEALRLIEQNTPDIVVTDLLMPDMDGLELVQILRHRHPRLPVVLMTAYGSESIALEALRYGAASYVTKQNLAQDLVSTVDGVLARVHIGRRQEQLFDCLTYSDSGFVLQNDEAVAAMLLEHIQYSLDRMRLCDGSAMLQIGSALEAALSNALYHGNLELGDQAHCPGRAALAKKRAQETPYRDRRIHVRAKLSPDEILFQVRDEGRGFQHEPDSAPVDPEAINAPGRGLVLMRTMMDQVLFNDVGNEVTLIKRSLPAAERGA